MFLAIFFPTNKYLSALCIISGKISVSPAMDAHTYMLCDGPFYVYTKDWSTIMENIVHTVAMRAGIAPTYFP